MDGNHLYNTRSKDLEKEKHFPEEVNPTEKLYGTGVPTLEASPTADSMQLHQQALAVLITTTAEEKVARQRAEEMAHEREELHLEAEMKHREFELVGMTKWELAEQERQVRMMEMEKDSVECLRKQKNGEQQKHKSESDTLDRAIPIACQAPLVLEVGTSQWLFQQLIIAGAVPIAYQVPLVLEVGTSQWLFHQLILAGAVSIAYQAPLVLEVGTSQRLFHQLRTRRSPTNVV